MLIQKLAVAGSVLALTACAGAEARQTQVDDKGDYHVVMDRHGTHVYGHISRKELLELRLEISEEVREELADARADIQEALEDARLELSELEELAKLEHLEGLDIEADLDIDSLEHTILKSVEFALHEAAQSLREAEAEFEAKEQRMQREAEQLELEAEHLAREAKRMKREAERMRQEADRMRKEEERLKASVPLPLVPPIAPSAPGSPEDHSFMRDPAQSAPMDLERYASASVIQ